MIQNIPESYLQAPRQHADFFVYDFKMTTDVVKSKVNLTANMFSFLQMGEKKVHVEHGFVEVNNKQSVLIRSWIRNVFISVNFSFLPITTSPFF
jgi:hypothetical protein